MHIGIASDHAGYHLKNFLISKLSNTESLQDLGPYSEDPVDYPDYIQLVCISLQNKKVQMGIAICGTGIGASIVANRFKNIRAALCHNTHIAEMARKHNDANILVMGARILNRRKALAITHTFLKHSFENGRHTRRVKKIEKLNC